MKTVWTQGIKDPDKKQSFELALRNSTLALGRLLEILDGMETDLLTKQVFTPEGEAWPFKQAHLNGRLLTIRELKDLLSFIRPQRNN